MVGSRIRVTLWVSFCLTGLDFFLGVCGGVEDVFWWGGHVQEVGQLCQASGVGASNCHQHAQEVIPNGRSVLFVFSSWGVN